MACILNYFGEVTQIRLHAIQPIVPQNRIAQDRIQAAMQEGLQLDRRSERVLDLVYRNSAIETRHSVLDDLDAKGSGAPLFFQPEGLGVPGTKQRNDAYVATARPMARDAARDVLERSHFAAREPTHLLTVSCTGFAAPGTDCALIEDLNLSPDIHRFHIGFMGCCAAFPALNLAHSLCLGNEEAIVLVVCVECCTLHFKPRTDDDSLVSAALFADGAAAAIVSALPVRHDDASLHLEGFATRLLPESRSEMAWSVGDHGFDMTLSAYVPRLLGRQIRPSLEEVLSPAKLEAWRTEARWAVHPGGRGILDHIEQGLDLPSTALDGSRSILSEYGNMSSPTILFVLERMLSDPSPLEQPWIAMAFGPGLTLELCWMSR